MNTIILLFFMLAVFALVYWGMTQLPLPPVVRTVVIVLMGLIALYYVWGLLGHGPTLSLR
jgi:hypothetical protein